MTTSSKLNFRSCQPKYILTNRTVNLFQYRALLRVNILIAFENTIKMSADRIRMSVDALIVFLGVIIANVSFLGLPYYLPKELLFLI